MPIESHPPAPSPESLLSSTSSPGSSSRPSPGLSPGLSPAPSPDPAPESFPELSPASTPLWTPQWSVPADSCGEALPDPAVCARCGAVLAGGTWRWGAAPGGAVRIRCAACRRVEHNEPAGYVTLEGPYATAHRGALEAEIARFGERARVSHPLRRLMALEEVAGRLLATTTDVELAHDIAHELRRRYGGELEGHFNRADCVLRMRWWH